MKGGQGEAARGEEDAGVQGAVSSHLAGVDVEKHGGFWCQGQGRLAKAAA